MGVVADARKILVAAEVAAARVPIPELPEYPSEYSKVGQWWRAWDRYIAARDRARRAHDNVLERWRTGR